MSNGSNMKAVGGAKGTQPSYSSTNTPALLLDKLNMRRSTPDSEALASSDDEVDPKHQVPPPAMHKPVRRASWLNDTTQPLSQPRKGSFASSSMSPTTSHPTTPSAESSTWVTHGPPSAGATLGRGHTSTSSFPWGTGIWNGSESRKEPPSRLTEVLPSPTAIQPPAFNGAANSSAGRDQNQDGTIPFAIPLHPTPKTYRSQSYSVGQLDPETPGNPLPPSTFTGRGRGVPHSSALNHRPSRPSMLSEMSSDGTGLGKVKEVDDDEEDTEFSPHSKKAAHDQAATMEELARENAILRQQNIVNARLRSRSTTQQVGSSLYGMGNVYGDVDNAIDERDEYNELQDITNRSLARRLSEYSAAQNPTPSLYTSIENRKLENVKKAYWQSSLGFGGLSDIPQSRRHSFADVPARQGSISSVGDPPRDGRGLENQQLQEQQASYLDTSKYAAHDHAATYFGGAGLSRGPDPYSMAPYPASVYNAYPSSHQYSSNRPTSPHRNMYGLSQPRQNQLLYIVLFKCSRADVFYVQEGTGLSVKPGDLVIVEADRGTDLGTVAQDNVEWSQAKELKDHYAEEHYKWLMMYSQGAAGTADGTGAGLMAASNGLQGSTIGGMGPPSQHGMQEPPAGELKPKIIKRLAQPHEVQALRDKEGNEAKAKRVCMQKVKEHGLHMEILDAEFQMDWKKLTFYYFADAYINFNSLVTDLFKVYKTRIWMSAINPASFASPNLGLQAPSGIGPGAVGVNRPANIQPDRRSQHEQPTSPYSNMPQANRGYTGNPGNTFQAPMDGSQIAPNIFQQASYGSYGYSPFSAPTRTTANSIGSFQPNLLQGMDLYTSYPSQGDYQRFAQNQGVVSDNSEYSRQGGSPLPGSDAWINAMQGLSLNSR